MHHHIEKKEWHYVLEESNYHLFRIFLNDKLVIAQPTYVSEEFKKLGFLDNDEIAADIPAYVRRVKENQLVVEPDELTEDEWSKRTDYYMDFSAYKDGKLAARMERYKLGTRNGSYAGMLYKKVLWNVHSFMYDIRLREALYILEMQNVVERFPRKGVRIRVISDKEIRDYIEALIGIVQLSCKLIENWSEDKYLQLKEIYMAAQKEMENGNIRDYILTVAQFFTVFVSFTNNTVFQHFTSEILFVTNVFAKTNWSQKLIQKFQMHLKAGLEAIKDEDFEKASEKLSQTLWITLEKSN